MKLEDLSPEAQEVVIGMIALCLNNSYAMGQDQGLIWHGDKECTPQPFRAELEKLVEENES